VVNKNVKNKQPAIFRKKSEKSEKTLKKREIHQTGQINFN